MNKRANFMAFLFGLVVGNKGLKFGWHIFYVTLIVLSLVYNPIVRWFGLLN